MQWIPWAYAVWQLLRTYELVLYIVSIVPFALLRWWSNKRVVCLTPTNIVAKKGLFWPFQKGDENYLTEHPPETFTIQDRDPRWPAKWRVVHFQGHFYFITRRSMRMMARWMSECDGNEENAIFLQMPRTSRMQLIGKVLSRKEAYEKIFSGDYCVDVPQSNEALRLVSLEGVTSRHVGTWMEYEDINRKWWVVLSIIPPLLQVHGLNRTSMMLTLTLIPLDVLRSCVSRILDFVILRTALFLKRRIFLSWQHALPNCVKTLLIVILIPVALAFPEEVFTSDYVREGECYQVKRGTKVNLQPFSKVKTLEEVSFTGEWAMYDPDARESYLRLWKGRALATPIYMQKNTQYAEVYFNQDVFVE